MELDTLFRELVDTLRANDPRRLHEPHRLRDIQYGLVPYRRVREALHLTCSEDHEMLLLRMCGGEGGYLEIADPDASSAFLAEIGSVNPDLSLLQVYGELEVRLAHNAIERAMTGADMTHAEDYAPPGAEQEAEDEAEEDEEEEEEELEEVAAIIPLPSPADSSPAPPPVPEPTILHPEPRAEPRDGAAPAGEAAEQWPPLQAVGGTTEPTSPAPEDMASAGSAPGDTMEPEAPAFEMDAGAKTSQCDFCGGSLPDNRQARFCPHCGQNLTTIQCGQCSAELEFGWRHCINCGHPVPDA